jgi:hypothetical protein
MLFDKNREIKFNYIFGDTQIVAYLEDSNDTIALAVRKKMYGLVNLETIELVKPIKYKMDYDSVYTEFVTIDDDYLIMRHYKDDEGNGFITVGDFNMKNPKQYFKIIPLDTAKQLIENENGGD